MSKCLSCETTEGIIHSGVDALLLGVDGAQTGVRCYACATKERDLKTIKKETEDGSI